MRDRAVSIALFFVLAGCNATKDKLVWVRGSDEPQTGARVEIEGGGFTSGASARIENVAEYASVPKDWTGPVPWEKRPTTDPDGEP